MSIPSASEANAAQIEYWNSAVGEAWAEEQARLDRAFAPLTAALVERAAAQLGERVLEVGCGCGDLALILARQVGPSGSVLALDISRPMLALARRRERERGSAEAAAIDWREADASAATLDPVHDLLVSRFGVMFFAEPTSAFGHLRGGLKRGGRLAMLCWRDEALNGWATVPMQALAARFGAPDPTPPFAPGPFALSDRDRTIGILREAGWREVAAEPVDAQMQLGLAEGNSSALDEAVHYALAIGPAARYLRERPEIAEAGRDLVRAALEPHLDGDAVRLPSACWLYSGRAS